MTPHAQQEATTRVERTCRLDLDSRTLRGRIAEQVASIVPWDAFCFGTLDPWTLLLTDDVSAGVPTDSYETVADNEYFEPDVGKFAELARSAVPISVLSLATGGDPATSHRFRTVLPTVPAQDELRAAFVTAGRCWGAISLFRSESTFTASEAGFLADLSEPIAKALRRAALRPQAGVGVRTAQVGPGVLLLDRTGRLVGSNSAGQHWLDELSPSRSAMHHVVSAARSGREARTRLRSRAGQWLSLWGSPLNGSFEGSLEGLDGPGVSLVIEPAPTSDIVQMLVAAHGLSLREEDVVQRVIAGAPSTEIARDLGLSRYTVQDHLKAVFDKVGVRTRGQLVSRILGQD